MKGNGAKILFGFFKTGLSVFAAVMVFAVLFMGSSNSMAAGKIKLGMSAAFTGPSGGLGVELYRGSMAYFTHLNLNDGINGKPVLIITRDDKYHPDPAIQNTIDFMHRSDVKCLFNYVGTPTVTRVLPLLSGYDGEKEILFFPFTGAEPQRQGPYRRHVFNLRASYQQELTGLVNHFVKLGLRRVAVFYQADAYGRSGWSGVRNALSAHGLFMVGEATYRRDSGVDDCMEEQVAILQRAKPDVVVCIGSYAACAAFIRDARNMNLDVPIANVSFVGSENMVSLLLREGERFGQDYTRDLVNSQVVPSYEDVDLPAVREYRHLMDTIPVPLPLGLDGDYHSLRYSFAGFEGFLNAKVMTAILRKLEAEPSLGLMGVAESLAGVDIGIGTPVSFTRDDHQGLKRVYFTTVRDGKSVPMTEEQWETWRK
ncbi:ABC transporter substrate-binding protein [uncultured Pseudodesulfovibrio sp.]|uniref:ABC transporter substrate-binding protein n=1 Tax=uncultured Pseudodesulfovibrio sp. TaxID=2035858 RepID=UPI0029C614B7|nr:ABC transporter substrate-binding protein [uncultured Pseudodesulfovibrio sp.]